MARSGPDVPVPLEQERERTIELLSQHFAYDNISLDELERRIERVYKATSLQAVRDVVRDLPSAVSVPAPVAQAQPPVYVQEEARMVSIMGSTRRSGLWSPPRRLDLWSIMSETRLDFTQAQMASGVTEIHLRAIMTSVTVIVPRGVRVVVQTSNFMSDVGDEHTDPPAVGSGAPVIRIHGPVFMAELKVRVRTREGYDE